MKKKLTYILLVLLLLPLIWGSTFAAGVCDNETMGLVVSLISVMVKFFSRGWVVLANLAGKLMTNDFVYGSFMNLDVYLWKLWNLSKNFANFFLGFYFLYMILKSFFDSEDNATKVVWNIGKFLIAWVAIQASWFLLAVLIDLATVATAAVGSLPGIVIESNEGLQTTISQLTTSPSTIILDLENEKTPLTIIPLEWATTDNKAIYDSVMPSVNSMAWPLIFLGANIFKFQDFSFLSWDQKACGNITLVTIINFALLIFFILPLVILVVVNIVRIFYLRMFISFSPLVILARVFEFDKSVWDALKKFNLTEAISLIFQPVLTVWAMSLILILVVSLFQLMGKTTDNASNSTFAIGWANFTSNGSNSSIEVPGVSKVTVDGGLFNTWSRTIGWFFGDIFLYWFVLILLWLLVVMVSKTSELTADISKGISDTAQNALKSIRFIPFAGQTMNLNTFMGKDWWWFKDSQIGKTLWGYESQYTKFTNAEFDSKLYGAFWVDPNVISSDYTKAWVSWDTLKPQLSWEEDRKSYSKKAMDTWLGNNNQTDKVAERIAAAIGGNPSNKEIIYENAINGDYNTKQE